jgi:hypothetical protein
LFASQCRSNLSNVTSPISSPKMIKITAIMINLKCCYCPINRPNTISLSKSKAI